MLQHTSESGCQRQGVSPGGGNKAWYVIARQDVGTISRLVGGVSVTPPQPLIWDVASVKCKKQNSSWNSEGLRVMDEAVPFNKNNDEVYKCKPTSQQTGQEDIAVPKHRSVPSTDNMVLNYRSIEWHWASIALQFNTLNKWINGGLDVICLLNE
ncbi:hypothetical protein J6590_019893 [Homalodisca vitripennis]|nr:hypothetical protein J6590_019893 [Homalodisca vitripennis]